MEVHGSWWSPTNTHYFPGSVTLNNRNILPLEAGVTLLIANGTFLHRDDFTGRFIEHGTSNGSPMAAIDWEAAITALASGALPCSAGEGRILQLSASLAADTPVSLRDTVTGLDNDNAARLLAAIRHAAGKRPGNSRYLLSEAITLPESE
jgi:hypothetical protein